MAPTQHTGMAEPPDRDDETGHWKTQFTDEAVLQVVRDADGFVTSGDVHRELGCSYDTARRRLKELVKAGELESKTVAGASVYSLRRE